MLAVTSPAPPTGPLARYRLQRARSRAFFDSLAPEAYGERPIALRNPFVFYEGHLPAFGVNTLVKGALGRAGIDAALETLFARGIDPEDEAAANRSGLDPWPTRDAVLRYADEADRAVEQALGSADLGDPSQREAVLTILEHEVMHQETLLYMAHRLPFDRKARPAGYAAPELGPAMRQSTVRIPAGRATLGALREEVVFGWDNELPSVSVDVPAFAIDARSVTNGDWLEFHEATGAAVPLFWERNGGWYWRGMFERIPLPLSWPVWVTGDEAAAFARWKGKRLPTEAEYHRAAFGTPQGVERAHPWGEAGPDASRAHVDFASCEPVPAGSRPAGASAWGVHDLVGNGWEWTSTPFEGFPGFQPMRSYPNYSIDFFDGKHWVLKGGSPVTDATLLRRTFRNWFRSNYPYLYAKFRCAGPV